MRAGVWWSRYPYQQRRNRERQGYRGNERRGVGLYCKYQPKGCVAGNEVCRPRDTQAWRRLNHQHLFHLRSDRLFGVRGLSWDKGAVRLLTKSAAVQYAPDKIRVNSIHPGLILTPMVADAALSQTELDSMVKITPLRR